VGRAIRPRTERGPRRRPSRLLELGSRSTVQLDPQPQVSVPVLASVEVVCLPPSAASPSERECHRHQQQEIKRSARPSSIQIPTKSSSPEADASTSGPPLVTLPLPVQVLPVVPPRSATATATGGYSTRPSPCRARLLPGVRLAPPRVPCRVPSEEVAGFRPWGPREDSGEAVRLQRGTGETPAPVGVRRDCRVPVGSLGVWAAGMVRAGDRAREGMSEIS
jgi:hypothetical protein